MQEQEAFAAVTTGFYRNPDPALAIAALRHWLRLVAAADDAGLGRLMVLLYLIARGGADALAAGA